MIKVVQTILFSICFKNNTRGKVKKRKRSQFYQLESSAQQLNYDTELGFKHLLLRC